MVCIFCDSQFADPITPSSRQKVCGVFDVSFNGRRTLHEGQMCGRCQVNVDLIENAARLKEDMNECLQARLSAMQGPMMTSPAVVAATPSVPEPPIVPAAPTMISVSPCHSPPSANHQSSQSPPQIQPAVSTAPPVVENGNHRPLVAAPLPTQATMVVDMSGMVAAPVPQHSAFMCVNCGKAFLGHAELLNHEMVCPSSMMNGGENQGTLACSRCDQNLKYRTPEERNKHMIQCQGRGLRRGRPSTGIFKCPKCGLSLKNRMNHDRLNHVNRCTGNGLKRGRPSLKSAEKYQCERCNRNLWSRDQLEMHLTKCDGTHIERRGRKPGNNQCPICNENLVYRHLLKKHLRQEHELNAQNLDDSMLNALKSRLSGGDMNNGEMSKDNIFQQTPESKEEIVAPSDVKSEPSAVGSDDGINHRKQGKPCRYVPELYVCNICNKKFEHQVLYEQHCCFKMQSNGGDSHEFDVECDGVLPDEILDGEDMSADSSTINSSMEDEKVHIEGNIVPSLKMRLPARSPVSVAKGSALAQVVSDLLGGHSANPNSSAMLHSMVSGADDSQLNKGIPLRKTCVSNM